MNIGNVLSLFDGGSCGQVALNRAKINYNTYYSSEIDKYAIKITQANYPHTAQLGDLTKWREWDIDWSKIGIILAGSPCQGFSFAGKQLAFDDPRSKLFFVFIEILNYCRKFNPNVYFLLENVDMKREHLRIISECCGVFPVNINSNLVSGQNRNRWYWSNIRVKKVGLFNELYTDIPQPKDKGILLKDILEKEVDEKYYLKDISKYNHSGIVPGGIVSDKLTLKNRDKAVCLDANYYKGISNHQERTGVCVAMRGRNTENPNDRTKGIELEQRLEPNTTGKTNCLSTVSKDNLIIQLNPSLESGGKQPYQQNRIYDENGITPALCANKSDLLISTDYRIRRLTPVECERLQTMDDNYTNHVSDSQRYKVIGNGWNIDTIVHIVNFLP